MAESASDYLRRFAAWRGGYVPPGQKPAAPAGIAPAGNGLPAGLSAAVPADQDTIYLVLAGTGACWQPGPSVNRLEKVTTGVWQMLCPGGHIGRKEIDEITVVGDSTATVTFYRNGSQIGSVELVNGIGGSAVQSCGCPSVTARIYA